MERERAAEGAEAHKAGFNQAAAGVSTRFYLVILANCPLFLLVLSTLSSRSRLISQHHGAATGPTV